MTHLLCFATPRQHSVAEKYLIPSVNKQNEFSVIYGKMVQEFQNPLWEKAKFIYLAAKKLKGEGDRLLAWSDNDAVFVKPVLERLQAWIQGHDVLYQSTNGLICTGFFFARLNKRFLNFLQDVATCEVAYTTPGTSGDQDAVRVLSEDSPVRIGLLPETVFWSPCHLVNSPSVAPDWTPKEYPKEMAYAHMTCIDYPHKLRVLDEIVTKTKPNQA